MSKKTICYVLVLAFFVLVAVGSSSSKSASYNNSRSSSSSSGSRESYVKPTEFPKTARTCRVCFGKGCVHCNYKGAVLE